MRIYSSAIAIMPMPLFSRSSLLNNSAFIPLQRKHVKYPELPGSGIRGVFTGIPDKASLTFRYLLYRISLKIRLFSLYSGDLRVLINRLWESLEEEDTEERRAPANFFCRAP